MSAKHHRLGNNYELLPRSSLDVEIEELRGLHKSSSSSTPWLPWLDWKLPISRVFDRSVYTHYITPRRRGRSVIRLVCWSVASIPIFLLLLVLVTAIFFPSYTNRPVHYDVLRRQAVATRDPGRANVYNKKIFISAALYEEKGNLVSGAWGRAVLQLIDLLGPENVHLSIYEDNPDPETEQALFTFRAKLPPNANATIVSEHLDLSALPHISLPTGEERLKRIAFLAKVRNLALGPIDTNGVRFDRVLFLNDVIFDPIDAVQLLFATNLDSSGRANYVGACAVDFINPFKFYDRWATVGFNADRTGIPFFPWFSTTHESTSRNDVLSETDAVRVRSCWGGMVAYDAWWFQQHHTPDPAMSSSEVDGKSTSSDFASSRTSPLRFRYENGTFWEASECCLINADLQYRQSGVSLPPENRIFMNPYIRVAYDERTLSWLSITRRPERLYSFIHDFLNKMVGMPSGTNRVEEEPGQVVTEQWWEYDDPARGLAANATNEDLKGHWIEEKRISEPGGWCGGPQLLVINEKPEHGDGRWSKIFEPHPPSE